MAKKRKLRRQKQMKLNTEDGPSGQKPVPYELSVRESDAFTRYYQMQGIVPEGEWDSFYMTLQRTLPTCFRVTGHRRQACELMRIIRSDFFSKMVEVDGLTIDPPKCISWYPDELAWQLDLTRKVIRGSDSLKQLHSFLVTETESGNISRQEAVSMIPPLLLDIQSHHKILDMCAAPGSKTAQIIEYLHRDESASIPEGYVVANDKDNKRCYLMVHQVKRLQSPCFTIINHDATLLPSLLKHSTDNHKEFVMFDRILADVPCSGDGTLRKNQELWAKWNPGLGINLHGLQSRILHRGLELLSLGGRMIYSTCSFNPVENEAVVAQMLLECQGAVRLVDASNELPGLQFVKGMTTWKVVTKREEVYERYEDVPAHHQGFLKQSMFPPPAHLTPALNLHYCMRIVPHHHDTGGFFVAVLENVTQLPWMKARVTQFTEETRSASPESSTVCPNSTTDAIDNRNNVTKDDKMKSDDKATEGDDNITVDVKASDVCNNDNRTSENCDNRTDTIVKELGNKKDQLDNMADRGFISDATGDKTVDTLEADRSRAMGDNRTGKETDVEESERSISVKREPDLTEADRKGCAIPKKPRLAGHREEPFLFFSELDPVWPSIREFFRVRRAFRADQLMYRCEAGTRRTLYFVSGGVKALVQCNTDRVKFINMGVKVFGRSPSPVVPQCDFRLSQEGLESITSFLDGRRVAVTRDDIVTMLTNENPLFSTLHATTQTLLDAISPGSVIFQFKPNESQPSPDCEIMICGWRGKASVRPFLSKNESQHYLRLCHALLPASGSPTASHSTGEDMTEASNKDCDTGDGNEARLRDKEETAAGGDI